MKDENELDAFKPFKRPEDDPERKRQDLKLALIAGFTVIISIALMVFVWMFLF